MLSPHDARLEPLREQAKSAHVIGMCPCGCATIDFAVDRARTPEAVDLSSPAVDSHSRVDSLKVLAGR